jgi:hypothetical protein
MELPINNSYSVIVETNGKRKTPLSKKEVYCNIVRFYAYHINPYEERVLIIIREYSYYGDRFSYTGCDLATRFK